MLLNDLQGDSSQLVEDGPASQDFKDRVGKTHYVGRSLPAGYVWKAKGAKDSDGVSNVPNRICE